MMTAAAPRRDRLGAWCGSVLIGGAALTPLMAWLGPLGFAPLLAVMGLASLPSLRIRDQDRPIAVALLAALVWAGVSTLWSPFHPKHPQDGAALKLAFELPLFWAAVCGARRAEPRLARRALAILAWGLAALGVLLLVEAATNAAVYRAVHEAFLGPIRDDYARKNLAQGSFVLALLWPIAAAGGVRAGAPRWLALPMAAGAGVLAVAFLSDAPGMAVGLGVVVGLAAWRWPKATPTTLAAVASLMFLVAPAVVWGVRELADYAALEAELPVSWAMRMSYWSHAVDWIIDHPLRGWGLDASRAFGPGIQLHPHNGALQVWLELGVLGAAAATAFWWFSLRRLVRAAPELMAAGACASAAVYLLFGALNFGVWQEWWLALGTLVAVLAATPARGPVARASTRGA
ncbi:MAG: O-antigen ligase family protein [Phenylobacterium sp.]